MNQLQSYMEASPHQFGEDLEYKILLYEIIQELQATGRFFDIHDSVEEKLRALLRSERAIIFKRGRHKRELSATIRVDEDIKEIRVDFSASSIAGYVAMTEKPVCIQDVSNHAALEKIHPLLRNNAEADQSLKLETKSTLAVPIFHGKILIGVMQLVNRVDGKFSTKEFSKLKIIASLLGDRFFEEIGLTEGPYDILIKRGLVTEHQLAELALNTNQDGSVASQLINNFQIPRDVVGESLSSFYQIPFANPEINAGVSAKLIQNINANYVRNRGWLPIAENGLEVTIVIDDPTDTERLVVIEQLFRGRKIKLLLMLREEIMELAKTAFDDDLSLAHSLEQLTDMAAEEVLETREAGSEEGIDQRDPSSNVVRLLNRIIADAYTKGASDIHIQPHPSGKPAQVLFRIDGSCRPATRIPDKLVKPVISRLKVMCSLDPTEKRVPQDGKCKLKCRGQNIEVRVALIPNALGLETAVLRLLTNCQAMHIQGLHLSEINLKETKRLSEKPHGLLLVVGPTGSGKTTSLHSVVGHLNNGEKIIWTIEDPVEITQPGLQQVSVNKKTGLTFATALRSFLRADPDVILIGEMRDAETAGIAIQASMTGHQVLSTLHTNSAAETINRLHTMGVDPFDLADSLLGILSQRLARAVCTQCRTDSKIDNHQYDFLKQRLADEGIDCLPSHTDLKLEQGAGCDSCGHTGYRGRIGIHELLVATPIIKELIAKKATSNEIVAQSRIDGLPSFIRDAADKLFAGQIDFHEFRKLAV